MSLREKQSKFAHMVALLILHAEQLGFEVTGGDWYRDPRSTYGHPRSLHRKRLAFDPNLFLDGRYLDGNHSETDKAYNDLHDFWDSIGGAKRIKKDLIHFSLEHDGVR